MLFDSIDFFLFLPVVILLYYALPHKLRWILLLVASYFFYGSWKIEFLLLIMYSTAIDYIAAIQVVKSPKKSRRRFWLLFSLVSNFSVLFVFKYFNFFIGSTAPFIDFIGQHPKVAWLYQALEYGVPVGISFYTFQSVGYMIDVYQEKIKPERNIGKFALFVSYFPQLVAGPIERFSNLHPQLFAYHTFDYKKLTTGFKLILYGLFIKMVIADNIAPLVDPVFANPLLYSQGDNQISLLLFSLQIYADFYGYSLIAIGVAKLMGVDLMDNFRTPYFAVSIKEFWSRWHISLSQWFRDYLYIPLGGNRVSYLRWLLNIMIVFVISGIWHGANYTFIIWGLIHGLMYLSEQVVGKVKWADMQSIPFRIIGLIKTLLVINVAWLFFRSDTLAKAYLSLTKIVGGVPSETFYLKIKGIESAAANEGIEEILAGTAVTSQKLVLDYAFAFPLVLLFFLEILSRNKRIDRVIEQYPFALRWLLYALLLYFVLAMSGIEFYQFIYFQF